MRASRRGFTLVELLVVMGVIAVLISLLLPALKLARQSAERTRTASALRQVLAGYVIYHQDNKGSLLFGYTPPTINGRPVIVTSRSGHEFGFPVSDRWPWRLAPYVQDVWRVIHPHKEAPAAPLPGEPLSSAISKAYRLSLNPAFGINSVYLGGHAGGVYKGFAGPNGDSPNTGKHVAFKASEVRRTSEQIVFTEVKGRNAGFSDPEEGMHFVTPPRAGGLRWRVVRGKVEMVMSGAIAGIPESRSGRLVVTGFFDGHVEAVEPSALQDMRKWAPKAMTSDYDLN